MNGAEIAAVVALVGLPIAVAQWSAARAKARSAEIDLLQTMRTDWVALKPQWHRALLTVIGPESYYSPADSETRERFRSLLSEMESPPETRSDAWHEWHQRTRDASHEYEQAERDVLFFLATLASAVFRGRLSADLAYAVVGLDVVRRSRQIRVLLGEEEGDTAWRYWIGTLPGLTDRILGLMDVLWAEASRRYDLQTHDLVRAAKVKRNSGSGLRNRLRIRRLVREHGRRLTSWRLERLLLAGEYLRAGPPRDARFVGLEQVPRDLQGWGWQGRRRKLRAFASGRRRRAMTVETIPHRPGILDHPLVERDGELRSSGVTPHNVAVTDD